MNKSESGYVSMHDKSSTSIDVNPTRFAPNPTTDEAKTALHEGIATEKQIAQKQDELKHSSNEAKAEAHIAAATGIYETRSKIASYASDTHNLDLFNKVSITYSDFKKLNDNLFFSRCETILSCGREHLAQLPAYLVTAQTLTHGDNLLEAFRIQIKNKGQLKIDLKSITNQLERQIKITTSLLKPFDKMVEPFRFTDPIWYNEWWDARSIPHSPTARVSVKANVFDAETNQPLPGAILTVARFENGKALTSAADLVRTVKIKSAGGGVNLKALATGAYLFTVSYAGCADKETIVYVNEGIVTRVGFPLTKLPDTE